jgi:hypothetical protein
MTEHLVNTATLPVSFCRWALPAMLVLSSIICAGCASNSVALSQAAVAANSPAAQIVGPREVFRIATKYVAEHPGTDYMVGSGDSMQPLYKDHTVIITERVPISGLKQGMTVVFMGDCGFPVAHVLVEKTTDGWMAWGLSNPRCDARRVRDDNYIAIVIWAYEPTSSPLRALISNPTVRPEGALIASNP